MTGKEMSDALLSGLKPNQIAKKFHISTNTVYTMVDEYRRTEEQPETKRDRMIQMVAAGNAECCFFGGGKMEMEDV